MFRIDKRIQSRSDPVQGTVWDEEIFRFLLTIEQRRSQRSHRPFVLMILDTMNDGDRERSTLQFAMPAVAGSIRETDVLGWIEKPAVLGIIFTQMDSTCMNPNMTIVRTRMERALHEKLGRERTATIAISSHIFTDPLETFQFDSTDIVLGQFSAIQ